MGIWYVRKHIGLITGADYQSSRIGPISAGYIDRDGREWGMYLFSHRITEPRHPILASVFRKIAASVLRLCHWYVSYRTPEYHTYSEGYYHEYQCRLCLGPVTISASVVDGDYSPNERRLILTVNHNGHIWDLGESRLAHALAASVLRYCEKHGS